MSYKKVNNVSVPEDFVAEDRRIDGISVSRDYYIDNDLWLTWSGTGSYGKALYDYLKGYTGCNAEVMDAGKYVTVRVEKTNKDTGDSKSRMFVLVFKSPKSADCVVWSGPRKYRTASSVSSAASYMWQLLN